MYLEHVPLCADDQGMCTFTCLIGVWRHCYKIRHCRQREWESRQIRLKHANANFLHPHMRVSPLQDIQHDTALSPSSSFNETWPNAWFYLLNTHTPLWVVSRNAGLRQILDYLLLQHFRVINMQFGSFVHQILRDVDTGGLSETQTHRRDLQHKIPIYTQIMMPWKRPFMNKREQQQ